MENILQKNQHDICEDVLKIINNESVNIETEENAKSSLYVFLNNTIYISNKTNNKKSKEEQNKAKVLVIAHECAHSIQPKVWHIINFVLSNIELLLFVTSVLICVFFNRYTSLVNSYAIISILSIGIRWYLEMNATINSVKITIKYFTNSGVDKESIKELLGYYKK